MEVKLTLLVVSLLVSAVVGQLEVQKCKKGAIPNKLEIEGCTKAPCQIVNGQNLRFKAEFTNRKCDEKFLKPIWVWAYRLYAPSLIS